MLANALLGIRKEQMQGRVGDRDSHIYTVNIWTRLAVAIRYAIKLPRPQSSGSVGNRRPVTSEFILIKINWELIED